MSDCGCDKDKEIDYLKSEVNRLFVQLNEAFAKHDKLRAMPMECAEHERKLRAIIESRYEKSLEENSRLIEDNLRLRKQVSKLRDALERIFKMDTCDADYEDGGPCLGTCPKAVAKQALSELDKSFGQDGENGGGK